MITGMAIEYVSGSTDFLLAVYQTDDDLHDLVKEYGENPEVASIEACDPEDLLHEQYDGVAYLTSEASS